MEAQCILRRIRLFILRCFISNYFCDFLHCLVHLSPYFDALLQFHVFVGGAQYALYVPIFGRMFPGAADFAAKSVKEKVKDGKGLAALFGQLFLDQFVVSPFIYFPAFYATREIVTNADKPDMNRAMTAYRKNMTEDLIALWKIWVPSMFLNFAFMPMWARIPWVTTTSLLWTCIISAMRGGEISHKELRRRYDHDKPLSNNS